MQTKMIELNNGNEIHASKYMGVSVAEDPTGPYVKIMVDGSNIPVVRFDSGGDAIALRDSIKKQYRDIMAQDDNGYTVDVEDGIIMAVRNPEGVDILDLDGYVPDRECDFGAGFELGEGFLDKPGVNVCEIASGDVLYSGKFHEWITAGTPDTFGAYAIIEKDDGFIVEVPSEQVQFINESDQGVE